ncbi:hypothetical protein MXM33_07540 [Acinetobacter vivianii]|uniref:hypothetical protein n=1 Tax=Acinetobacter vivianii TaxID=1776742 RepID=UPI002DB6E1E4|nr:hypothetical protein [Acinetobacter vivianii]MEB6666883.1 hypothetical protein [Acinetobacter vivianii]
MILQQNFESQLDNIINILAYKYGKELSEIKSLISLKRLYNRYISEMHNIDFTDFSTTIVTEKKRSKKLLSIFNGDVISSLDDRNQVNLINNKIINRDLEKEYGVINNALEQIKKISEEYFTLFNLIINEIFIFPAEGARGGSSSTAVGLIWANPKFDTPLNDTMEFMIHELTHNCMFIDEIRYGHYHYNEIIKEES